MAIFTKTPVDLTVTLPTSTSTLPTFTNIGDTPSSLIESLGTVTVTSSEIGGVGEIIFQFSDNYLIKTESGSYGVLYAQSTSIQQLLTSANKNYVPAKGVTLVGSYIDEATGALKVIEQTGTGAKAVFKEWTFTPSNDGLSAKAGASALTLNLTQLLARESILGIDLNSDEFIGDVVTQVITSVGEQNLVKVASGVYGVSSATENEPASDMQLLLTSANKNYVPAKGVTLVGSYIDEATGALKVIEQTGTGAKAVFKEWTFTPSSDASSAKAGASALTLNLTQLLARESILGTDLNSDEFIGDVVTQVITSVGEQNLVKVASGAYGVSSATENEPASDMQLLLTSGNKNYVPASGVTLVGSYIDEVTGAVKVIEQTGTGAKAVFKEWTFTPSNDGLSAKAGASALTLNLTQLLARESILGVDLNSDEFIGDVVTQVITSVGEQNLVKVASGVYGVSSATENEPASDMQLLLTSGNKNYVPASGVMLVGSYIDEVTSALKVIEQTGTGAKAVFKEWTFTPSNDGLSAKAGASALTLNLTQLLARESILGVDLNSDEFIGDVVTQVITSVGEQNLVKVASGAYGVSSATENEPASDMQLLLTSGNKNYVPASGVTLVGSYIDEVTGAVKVIEQTGTGAKAVFKEWTFTPSNDGLSAKAGASALTLNLTQLLARESILGVDLNSDEFIGDVVTQVITSVGEQNLVKVASGAYGVSSATENEPASDMQLLLTSGNKNYVPASGVTLVGSYIDEVTSVLKVIEQTGTGAKAVFKEWTFTPSNDGLSAKAGASALTLNLTQLLARESILGVDLNSDEFIGDVVTQVITSVGEQNLVKVASGVYGVSSATENKPASDMQLLLTSANKNYVPASGVKLVGSYIDEVTSALKVIEQTGTGAKAVFKEWTFTPSSDGSSAKAGASALTLNLTQLLARESILGVDLNSDEFIGDVVTQVITSVGEQNLVKVVSGVYGVSSATENEPASDMQLLLTSGNKNYIPASGVTLVGSYIDEVTSVLKVIEQTGTGAKAVFKEWTFTPSSDGLSAKAGSSAKTLNAEQLILVETMLGTDLNGDGKIGNNVEPKDFHGGLKLIENGSYITEWGGQFMTAAGRNWMPIIGEAIQGLSHHSYDEQSYYDIIVKTNVGFSAYSFTYNETNYQDNPSYTYLSKSNLSPAQVMQLEIVWQEDYLTVGIPKFETVILTSPDSYQSLYQLDNNAYAISNSDQIESTENPEWIYVLQNADSTLWTLPTNATLKGIVYNPINHNYNMYLTDNGVSKFLTFLDGKATTSTAQNIDNMDVYVTESFLGIDINNDNTVSKVTVNKTWHIGDELYLVKVLDETNVSVFGVVGDYYQYPQVDQPLTTFMKFLKNSDGTNWTPGSTDLTIVAAQLNEDLNQLDIYIEDRTNNSFVKWAFGQNGVATTTTAQTLSTGQLITLEPLVERDLNNDGVIGTTNEVTVTQGLITPTLKNVPNFTASSTVKWTAGGDSEFVFTSATQGKVTFTDENNERVTKTFSLSNGVITFNLGEDGGSPTYKMLGNSSNMYVLVSTDADITTEMNQYQDGPSPIMTLFKKTELNETLPTSGTLKLYTTQSENFGDEYNSISVLIDFGNKSIQLTDIWGSTKKLNMTISNNIMTMDLSYLYTDQEMNYENDSINTLEISLLEKTEDGFYLLKVNNTHGYYISADSTFTSIKDWFEHVQNNIYWVWNDITGESNPVTLIWSADGKKADFTVNSETYKVTYDSNKNSIIFQHDADYVEQYMLKNGIITHTWTDFDYETWSTTPIFDYTFEADYPLSIDIDTENLIDNMSIQALVSNDHWLSELISYGFNSVLPNEYTETDIDSTISGTLTDGWKAFNNTDLKSWIQTILDNVADLTDLNLVMSSSNSADIRFNLLNDISQGTAAFAYMPGDDIGGDIFLDSSLTEQLPLTGSYEYMTIIHELGHALGLKHPFEGDLRLPSTLDHHVNTVMSYTDFNSRVPVYTLSSEEILVSYESIYPSSFMVYDIAALQYLYGINDTSVVDNIYHFDEIPFYLTIWDAGGMDTLDFSQTTGINNVNLTSGSYSDINFFSIEDQATQQALLWEKDGFSDQKEWLIKTLTEAKVYTGENALGLAYGVIIENVLGGDFGNTIIDNFADNFLKGGEGNDSFYLGAGGDDVIDAGNGKDTLYLNLCSSEVQQTLENNVLTIVGQKTKITAYGIENVIYASDAGCDGLINL